MSRVHSLFHIVIVSPVGFASSAVPSPLPQHRETRNAVFLMTGAGGILLLWLHHPSRTQFSRSLSCGWAETMNAGFMKFIPQIQRNKGGKKKSPPPPHSWLQAATVYSSQPELYIDHCQAPGLPYTCDLSTSAHSKPLPALLPSPTASLPCYLTPFLGGGIQCYSVPPIPGLGLEKT